MNRKSLHQLYAEHTGKVSDKWSLYLTECDRLFDDYRDKPVRLLEIGVQNGGSLEIWSKYFSNASALIGCDINPDCARLSYDDPRIGVIVGDANAPDVREQVLLRSPQFDIIIDDGSHLSSDIIKSFALYFPRVVEGGVFIAEDLHCSYWGHFEGGLFYPYSSISFFKRLADVINHEHWGIPKARADILRGIFTKYGCEVDAEALSQVHSVEFINSMCVVRKAPAVDNGLGRRVIAGSMELVIPGFLERHGRPYQIEPLFDQSRNPWTARTTPPDEAIQHTELLLANAQQQIAGLEHAIQAIENSLSWRMTRPLRRAKASPLGIVGWRAAKLVWWAITLPLPKKLREWKMSKSVREVEAPHFAPPSDDYCFAIPFNYSMERPAITPTVAVICHMYYLETLEEFKHYLSNIPFPFDLFITTDTEQKKIDIANGLLDWNGGAVEIRLAPNRGRDIAPKLITCRDVYDRYEFFLHIHSKKSPQLEVLDGWRSYLLETLLGSEKIVESIFEAFDSDPKLGMIAPEHFTPVRGSIGWGWNFDAAKKFAGQLGVKISLVGKIDFPSGSMFWGRSAAIKPLLKRRLSVMDFPAEDGQMDATLGHIIERLYFFVCEQAGYRWIKVGSPALLKNVERMIFIESKASLTDSIKVTQYGLLASNKEKSSGLSMLSNSLGSYAGGMTQSWRTVHAQSDLRTMEFSQFCDELEKHISKQESKIDFDENFYLEANPDIAEKVARGWVSCGYVHYCLEGQYEGRSWSDRQLKRRFSIKPSYPRGFLAPVDYRSACRISLAQLPKSPKPILLILFAYLQENLFFAGYSEFFKDYGPVFDRFDRVIIAVEHAEFDRKIALRYSRRIEVMHMSEIDSLKYQPDIIVGFSAHLTCAAYQMLPDNPERVVYYCQEFESGFFPYGADYIVGEQAIVGSRNLIVSTELLRKFLVNRGLVNHQRVFVIRPKIELFDVPEVKTNRLFFYYRPESFNERNLPETLMQTVQAFCYKYSGYEIYMVGSVATSYSFKVNGTQIYVVNKLPKKDYVELISSCDVVVSLIYAAHPGVIAFQTAASGIPTITNVFENRDASLLKNISKNIVPYDPVRDSLLVAIEYALVMPKGQASFDEALYSGNRQGSLVEFHDNILLHREP
jgi:hypothetical protein